MAAQLLESPAPAAAGQNAADLVAQARVVVVRLEALTTLMPSPLDVAVAVRATRVARDHGVVVPPQVCAEGDYLEVIRCSQQAGPQALADVERVCREQEIAAARCARLVPGWRGLLGATAARGGRALVVSEVSSAAVECFLSNQGLAGLVESWVARSPARAPRDQGDPYALDQLLAAHPHGPAVLVGTCSEDIQTAGRVGIAAVVAGSLRSVLQAAQ